MTRAPQNLWRAARLRERVGVGRTRMRKLLQLLFYHAAALGVRPCVLRFGCRLMADPEDVVSAMKAWAAKGWRVRFPDERNVQVGEKLLCVEAKP